jgi:predicted Zn-dependent protease
MKKYSYILTAVVFGIAVSCAINPFSGKKTLAFVPDSQILPSAFAQYSTFLKENTVVNSSSDARLVESVGIKIKNAAERYLNANGYQGYLKDYRWEYKLIDNKEVNAWCMPGGKIVVYTGILPITKNEAGLATVMGHEVAHALANHGQQRMSGSMIQQLVGVGAQVLVSEQSQQTQALAMQAYGAGSQVLGMLPFSRSHETEADQIGLTLMAIAGYNPDESILFWGRMAAKSGGGAPPEFLSTHPSDQTRMNNLKRLIPQAKAEAAKFGVTFK